MLRFFTCLAFVILMASAGRAHADDAIALLPLDSDQKLEIYGQPVASELARVLVAGKIDVVVVGRKMAVPERARLIVDGTIKAGKGGTVVLTVRVRNTADGTELATMESTAPSLANIDKAAADLSARVLTSVRQLLVATAAPTTGIRPPVEDRPPIGSTTPALRPMLVSFTSKGGDSDRLRAPLTLAVMTWAGKHLRDPKTVPGDTLSKKLATKTVKASGIDLAIGFEILAFDIDAEGILQGRARVRVRISDAVGILFDRVIKTDTIVGEKLLTVEKLAERTAREVVDILRPHVMRTVAGWR